VLRSFDLKFSSINYRATTQNNKPTNERTSETALVIAGKRASEQDHSRIDKDPEARPNPTMFQTNSKLLVRARFAKHAHMIRQAVHWSRLTIVMKHSAAPRTNDQP
jgi:hypothetical protein